MVKHLILWQHEHAKIEHSLPKLASTKKEVVDRYGVKIETF